MAPQSNVTKPESPRDAADIRIVDFGTRLIAWHWRDGAEPTMIGSASRQCVGGSRGQSWYWDIWVGSVNSDARRKPQARAELTRLATEAVSAPPVPRDAVDWRESPDLMSLDDKLDAAFGPADEATAAWVEAALRVGSADCGVAW